MTRGRGRRVALAVLGLLALLGFLALRAGDAPPAGVPARTPAPGANHAAPAALDPVAQVARGPLPRSLRGTEVDGGLRVDDDGHLITGPDTLALFEYFLAASGEEPLAVIRRRILDHIERELHEPAAGEASALLKSHLAYRAALRDLAETGDVPDELERRWQWLRELRRAHFGAATAEALFGAEEDVVRIDLARRQVALDPTLDEQERAERLLALDASLPESTRRARERARAPAGSHREVAALRAEGGSDEEVFSLRERHFGTEAAQRLAALDAERSRWDARLARYRSERDALLHAGGFADEAAQEAALAALRREHFSADELARVRALDASVSGP